MSTELEEKQAPPESAEEQIKIPETLPVLPLRDIVIFPFMIVPLFVSRERSIRAVDQALALSSARPLRVDDPELALETGVELRAELQAGLLTSPGDFNPLRALDKRK